MRTEVEGTFKKAIILIKHRLYKEKEKGLFLGILISLSEKNTEQLISLEKGGDSISQV